MKARKVISNFLRVVSDEAERNPDFERRLVEAFGLEGGKLHDQVAYEASSGPAGRRPKNRRSAAVLDPVEVARLGESELRARLATMSIEQLKDIVAEFGMDPGKLVIKWKSVSRIIDRIVEISVPRAQKGDAFRTES